MGNRLPDREVRVEEFFLKAAVASSEKHFLLGGAGWSDRAFSPNITYIGHVPTRDHNAFNVSARAVLNISRESMAQNGFSPATRVFEATGAGACLITDHWEGIDQFFKPGEEILVARDGQDVADIVRHLTDDEAQAIGSRALVRALSDHTYTQRALTADTLFRARLAKSMEAAE